ncbi:MAG TPA: hypothetical protein VF123_13135 [Candidatus Sulfotelmatobacter sp.]
MITTGHLPSMDGSGVATMLLTLMLFLAVAAIVLIAFGTFGDLWAEWRHPDHRPVDEQWYSVKTRHR